MNELPPDLPRLRAILAYLDLQVAQNETIGIYLRLQRQNVVNAISRAEAPKRPRSAAPAGANGLPTTGYVLERRDTNDATKGAVIHVAGCDRSPHDGRPVEPELVRKSLTTDPRFFQACELCRPDTALGMID